MTRSPDYPLPWSGARKRLAPPTSPVRDRSSPSPTPLRAMNKALAGDIPPEEHSRLEEAGRIVYPPHGLPEEEIAVVDGPVFWAARTRQIPITQ